MIKEAKYSVFVDRHHGLLPSKGTSFDKTFQSGADLRKTFWTQFAFKCRKRNCFICCKQFNVSAKLSSIPQIVSKFWSKSSLKTSNNKIICSQFSGQKYIRYQFKKFTIMKHSRL